MNFKINIQNNNKIYMRILLVSIVMYFSFGCSGYVSKTDPLCAQAEFFYQRMSHDTISLLIFEGDEPFIYKEDTTYVQGFF